MSAEAIPRPGLGKEAAAALRAFGFRVLEAGVSISVEGPPELYARAFGLPVERAPFLDAQLSEPELAVVLESLCVQSPATHFR